MPPVATTLTDVSAGIWLDSFQLAAGGGVRLAGSERWSLTKRTLRGGRSEGVDVVDVDNGRLSLSMLPTRGMGVWRGTCDGLTLGWKSPVELPVNPAYVDPSERGGIGWLSGFNEWICRCGLESNGPPGPEGTLHGRIANLPAHDVRVTVDPAGAGTITVEGVVDESQMFGPNLRLNSTLTTEAGSNRFTIIDRVTNRRGAPADLELLYHINTGRPFLEPGGRCVAPAVEVAPRDARAAAGNDHFDSYAAPDAAYAEQVYFYRLAANAQGNTLALLRSAHGDKGLCLRWNVGALPHFTLWKNTGAEADGYVTGLEPATNFPNLKSFERDQGRVIRLPPGGTHEIRLEVSVHSVAAEVRQIEQEIAELLRGRAPLVHRLPREGWSPA